MLIVNSYQTPGADLFEALTDTSNLHDMAPVGAMMNKEDFVVNSQLGSKYSRAIAALKSRKEQVQMQINSEMKSRMPCSVTLARLKKMKLWTKDRIASLQSSGRRNGSAITG